MLLFTATDLHVFVIRDIIVTNRHSAAQQLQIYIQSGPNFYILMAQDAISPGASVHLELRQEILPSEELWAVGQTGPFQAVVTGYALTTP